VLNRRNDYFSQRTKLTFRLARRHSNSTAFINWGSSKNAPRRGRMSPIVETGPGREVYTLPATRRWGGLPVTDGQMLLAWGDSSVGLRTMDASLSCQWN